MAWDHFFSEHRDHPLGVLDGMGPFDGASIEDHKVFAPGFCQFLPPVSDVAIALILGCGSQVPIDGKAGSFH